MPTGDPTCPNCGHYLANLGPNHMMHCHAPMWSQQLFTSIIEPFAREMVHADIGIVGESE